MRGIRVLAAAALLLFAGTSYADATATSTVAIQSFAFTPGTVTIAVGDTVTWVNRDGVAHTSTATGGAWSSGTLGPGATFSFTFRTPGTFAYRCAIHPSMTGTVIVQSAATPVPTAVPTPVPTPVPTAVPTPVPTSVPTPAVTAPPAPTPAAASSTGVPRATADASVPASPTESATPAAQPVAKASADTPPSPSESGVPAAVLLAATIGILALAGTALILLRR